MREHLLPAVRLTFVCIAFFAGFYTLLIWGIAQLSPNAGKGFVVSTAKGYNYANIGQTFTDNRYFWSRPSAVGYNAAGSAGSNKGPSNADYLAQMKARVDTFLVYHPTVQKTSIPADLVTASGSGLEPHISPQAAQVQVERVAKVRGLQVATVQQLVAQHTETPLLGLFGPVG